MNRNFELILCVILLLCCCSHSTQNGNLLLNSFPKYNRTAAKVLSYSSKRHISGMDKDINFVLMHIMHQKPKTLLFSKETKMQDYHNKILEDIFAENISLDLIKIN